MKKTNTKKKRSAPSPDSLLNSLLREIEQLKKDRDDDGVSEESWHRRGRMVMMKGARLPQAHSQVFQQHYLAMQQLEAAEQLESSLEAFDDVKDNFGSKEVSCVEHDNAENGDVKNSTTKTSTAK